MDMPNLLRTYLAIAECYYLKERYCETLTYCRHIIYIAESHSFVPQDNLLSKTLQIKSQSEMFIHEYASALITLNFLLE
jgi:hypothetical protein